MEFGHVMLSASDRISDPTAATQCVKVGDGRPGSIPSVADGSHVGAGAGRQRS
jgi:hypothetical protein